ncbi:MAG: hypothetical protein IK093_14635 [Ruminiclostridium sp.]|nr:hypothetical protein [Ruminiclostridium sp.]
MAENKRFRDSATPEERSIILERLKNGDSAPRIAFDMGLTLKVVCDIRNEALERGEITLPPEERPGLTSFKVQQYCIANNLFNRGSYERYERMLELAGKGFPVHDIATMIWICSETDKHAEEIEQDLRAMIPDAAERSEEYADQSGLSPAT